MTNFQKIVKYFAIVLSFALIAGIAAGVISGVSVLAKLTDLTTSDGKVDNVQEETIKKIRIKLFRTDKDGSVIILSDGKNIVSSK